MGGWWAATRTREKIEKRSEEKWGTGVKKAVRDRSMALGGYMGYPRSEEEGRKKGEDCA